MDPDISHLGSEKPERRPEASGDIDEAKVTAAPASIGLAGAD